MKKILFTFLSLCASFLIAHAQISLSFSPAKGDKYEYRFETSQDQIQNVMGQDINVQLKMSTVYDLHVLESGKEEIKVAFAYREMLYNVSSVMMNIRYDSKNPPSNPSDVEVIMGKIFDALLNKEFEVIILPDGTVKSVTGMEKIIEDMMAAVGTDPQAMMIGESMKGQFNNEGMKTTLEQSMKIYPKNKVKVNDTWKVEQQISNQNMTLDISSTYLLKSKDKKKAFIEVTSVLESTDGQFKGTQSGTMTMDIKTGLTEVSEITQNLAGSMKAQEMDIKMDIKTTVKVTTSKM